jgi:pimeloyl-ACP methyl ester carboxylesterase
MDSPVRWADNDGIKIAYRTYGDGPHDIIFVPMWASNIDHLDEYPPMAKAFESISSFARLIVYDRRGSGLSDRLCGVATLEEGMDDLAAVLDDAGAEHPSVMGLNEAGSLCCLFAATHPDKVKSLILYGTYATTTWQEDYPWGQNQDEREIQIQAIQEFWGVEGAGAVLLNPSALDDRVFSRWATRWQRNAVSRDALPAVFEMLAKTDVRHVLPSIRVPTLVLHRKDDFAVPVDNGRYLAEKIPNARLVELEGMDHIPFIGDWQSIEEEIEEFVTGVRRPREKTRVLATILFTDIVGSTRKASELGDRAWRGLLDDIDTTVKRQIDRWQGRLVKQTGDGHFATFDGPARAIRASCNIREAVKDLGVDIRAGLHTGEVEVLGEDLGGIAVHIGARVSALAEPGEVLVSGAIPPLVAGSGLKFSERGVHELRGIDGQWTLYSVNI